MQRLFHALVVTLLLLCYAFVIPWADVVRRVNVLQCGAGYCPPWAQWRQPFGQALSLPCWCHSGVRPSPCAVVLGAVCRGGAPFAVALDATCRGIGYRWVSLSSLCPSQLSGTLK